MGKIFIFIKKLFCSQKEKGSLTIIAVGPGDPSLLTIEATRALKKSKVIFYPISGEDKGSNSAQIITNTKKKKQILILILIIQHQFLLLKKNREKKILTSFRSYIKKNIIN